MANKPGLVAVRLDKYLQQEFEWNAERHIDDTAPFNLLWTSTTTFNDLAVGTPLNPMRGGQFVAVRASVVTAPSGGNLTYDVLLDGISIFDGGSLPYIASGQTRGKRKPVTRKIYFYVDSKLQFQVTASNSAVGPLQAVMECIGGQA